MDIWRWLDGVYEEYKDDNPRLLWMLFRLPGFIVDNDHERVDSLMPEALALARESKHPWIEIFLRHWNMQSRILHRSLIKDSLPEAIDLLERAHRDDAIQCPQTICVSQDVCVAYGRADGPGYSDIRIQVASETLERINPKWPCWRCISCEYANALLDKGHYEEALEFTQQQFSVMEMARAETNIYGFRNQFVDAYIGLGQLEKALEFNKDAKYEGLGEGFVVEKQIDQSRILSMLGRFDEAVKEFPPWSKVEGTQSDYHSWCHGAYLISMAGHWEGDDLLLPRFINAYHRLFQQGVVRQAIHIAHWAAEIATQAKVIELATTIVQDIEKMIPELHKTLDAHENLANLKQRIETEQSTIPPLSDDDRNEIEAQFSTGLSLSVLLNAAKVWPDWWDVQSLAADSWRTFGFQEKSNRILSSYLERNFSDVEALSTVCSLWLEQNKKDLHLKLARRYKAVEDPDVIVVIGWYNALWAEKRNELPQAIKGLEEIHALEPDNSQVLFRLVNLYKKQGQLEQALSLLNHGEVGPEYERARHWVRMMLATRLGLWDIVRESAVEVDWPVDAEMSGPIIQNGPLIRAVFPDEGVHAEFYAIRTGPVSGHIVQLSALGEIQHYDDWVVIDPEPLDLDAFLRMDEEQQADYIPRYKVDCVLQTENYRTFAVHGVHPGDAVIQSIKDQMSQLGVVIQVALSEDYELIDSETEKELPGVYALVGVPQNVDLEVIHNQFVKLSKDLELQWVWLELLEALGLDETMDEQTFLAERLGLR